MPDNTVNFKNDGTYKRGMDVQPLDVQKGVKKVEGQVDSQILPHTKATSQASTPPKPGTFSLNSLKATIASNPTPPAPAAVTMKNPEKDKPVGQQSSVKPMELKEKSKVDKSDKSGSSVVLEANDSSIGPSAADTNEDMSKSEQGTPESAEKFKLAKVEEPTHRETSQVKESEQADKEKLPLEISMGHVDDTHVASVGSGAIASPAKTGPTLDQITKGASVQTPVSDAKTSSEVKELKLEQSIPAGKSIATSTSAELRESASTREVDATKPEQSFSVSSTSSQKPTADLLKSTVDATGAETFNVLSLRDLFKLIDVSWSDACTWLQRCIKKRSSAPAAIFVPKFSSELRFYNFFSLGSQVAVGVVVGAREGISAGKLNIKSGTLEDISSTLHTEGNFVFTNKGDAVAAYSERKAGTMTI